ncbi:Nop53 [Kluyveromyces lactis]|nr:Nop53 [Kluyveromyces lactis]
MAGSKDRPAQYKQSSRKGKKAWRKNIDISDVERKLEEKQILETTHGKQNLTELTDDALFAVDTEGDQVLKQKLVKRKAIKKTLKSTEILESIKSKSKVPALTNPKTANKKHDKIQGVSKKELDRLLALAGKKIGESKLKARVAKEGLVKSGSLDLWGEDAGKEVKVPSGLKLKISPEEVEKLPKGFLKQSTTSWSVATVRPDSIARVPIIVKERDAIPHAGKSYNPSKEEWEALISTEYEGELINEQRRIALEQYKQRIQHLMDTIEDKEEEDSDSEEENESEPDDKDLSEEGEETRLSLNPATKNKKKTKYQRNKQRRHEEKVKLQQELKKLKEKVLKLEKLEEIQQEVESTVPNPVSIAGKVKKNKKHKLGTKHSVMEDNLEVKFSDELSDSLRKLRPEGNLLYDTVRALQSSGRVESRIPIRKGRRYKPRVTEKWTYKDFK